MVNLGLWVHLIQAIFHDLKEFLEAPKRTSGTSYFGKAKQTQVWNRFLIVYVLESFTRF